MCPEVLELLSDTIDARRGEIAHPDGTRLSQPGLRAAVELHLASCQSCKDELVSLETIGFAYADFSVGDVSAQHFQDYGSKIRERIKNEVSLPVLECANVLPCLSDVIDIRRGEKPTATRADAVLTESISAETFAAIEFHLTTCESCQAQLSELTEVGAAFAEFEVGAPAENHFAEYGKIIRARVAKEPGRILKGDFRPQVPIWRRSLKAVAATGLAASLAFVAMREMYPARTRIEVAANRENLPLIAAAKNNKEPVKVAKIKEHVRAPAPTGPMPMELYMPVGQELVAQNFFKDVSKARVSELPPEGKVGYFVMGERSLLGAYLKTTRDTDPVEGMEPRGLMVYSVVPNSPADAMGLRKDDYIVNINDVDVNHGGAEEALKFLSYLQKQGGGVAVTLLVVRREGTHWCFLKPLQGVLGETETSPQLVRRVSNF